MEKIKRTKVAEALKRTDFGATVNVKGWVRTHRSSKAVDFIALNDGSTINSIQIVIDPTAFDESLLKQITTGSCISVVGELVESQGSGQNVEILGKSIEIYGLCGSDYPMQKKGQTFEYMRQHAHLRLRTNSFGAIMRIRHNMAIAIHQYFHEHGFYYFHTPIITASDAEGAGEMFQVTTKNLYDLKKDEEGHITYNDDFFGKMTSLTVSGQLEGELGATALGQIYTFGPTFRAENSNTTRHLSEFWMIEPEIAFADLKENMQIAEDMIKYVLRYVLEEAPAEMEFFDQFIFPGVKERAEKLVNSTFARVTYTEAIELLKKSGQNFEYAPEWGIDLQTEHERFLSEKVFNGPVFVTDYPQEIKAFYMKLNEDGKTVRAMDMLVPGIGELI